MKYVLSILLITIAAYSVLCLASNFMFPAATHIVLSRAISGVFGAVSVLFALFVVKRLLKWSM